MITRLKYWAQILEICPYQYTIASRSSIAQQSNCTMGLLQVNHFHYCAVPIFFLRDDKIGNYDT